jgi:hypothetical protein
MKKLFLLSCIFLLAFLIRPINAQVQIGVQAGVNLTDINMDLTTQEGFNTAMRTRAIMGGIITYNFLPMLSLQAEPAYVQKGADANFSIIETGFNVDIKANISADYIDVPILLKASLPMEFIKPYLIAGGSVAFLVGDAKLRVDGASINGQDVISLVPDSLKEETLLLKSTDYILCFGGGVTIPIGLLEIFVEGRYDIGLTNINNDPTDDTEFKTTGVQIKAGLLFSL